MFHVLTVLIYLWHENVLKNIYLLFLQIKPYVLITILSQTVFNFLVYFYTGTFYCIYLLIILCRNSNKSHIVSCIKTTPKLFRSYSCRTTYYNWIIDKAIFALCKNDIAISPLTNLRLNGWWIIVIRTGLIIIYVNIQDEKITTNFIYC